MVCSQGQPVSAHWTSGGKGHAWVHVGEVMNVVGFYEETGPKNKGWWMEKKEKQSWGVGC